MALGIEQLIEDVIDREGGYVNDPRDRGGATCWGITEAVARKNGYRGEMRAMTRAAAADVYRTAYWFQPGFDVVWFRAPLLGAELFDTGVNMGPTVASAFLQRALNALNRNQKDYGDLVVDGVIGQRTTDALGCFLAQRGKLGEAVLVKAVDALQGERYMALAEGRPANEAFLYGWLANRIGSRAEG